MGNEIVVPLTMRYQLMLRGAELVPEKQQQPGHSTFVCPHNINAMGYWQQVALLPVSVMEIVNQTIYCHFQDIPIDSLRLQASTLFISNQQNNRVVVEVGYFLEHYKRGDWLLLYCRICRVIFQLYQL